jgi:hypothetical protein
MCVEGRYESLEVLRVTIPVDAVERLEQLCVSIIFVVDSAVHWLVSIASIVSGAV